MWCLGLSGMPLATYIAYIWARSTRFSPCSSRGLQGPWRLAAAADEQIERLSVVLQAVARCSWFTSCLGLSDMPLPTPTAHLQPQSTRFSAVDQLVASCPPWTAAPKRLSQWSGRQGTGTS